MLPAITWFLVLGLAVAWSISAWVLHALVVWSMSSVCALAGQASTIEGVTLPTSVALWIPPELLAVSKTAAAIAWPYVETGLSMLPSLAGWLTPLAWAVWGMGFLTLLAIGALLHAVIFATQKAVPN